MIRKSGLSVFRKDHAATKNRANAMKKAKKTKNPPPRKMTVYSASADEALSPAADEQIFVSNLSLHELFQQQTATMLERADITEEERQTILIGMSCPCCGAGGFSFTAKLRR
jgi:hypothetical protein